jgi:hypothetical protein
MLLHCPRWRHPYRGSAMRGNWPRGPDSQSDDFESGLRHILSTLQTSSSSRFIAMAVASAFVLTCLRTGVLAQVYGYSAPNSDEGARSLVTTWFTLSAGLAPVALGITKRTLIRHSSLGSLIGVVVGGLYGLFVDGLLTCGLCGACIGALTGFTLGLNGIHPNRNHAKLFIGTVVGAVAVLALAGFMKPVTLVPVGQARLDAEKTRLEERMTSSDGGIQTSGPIRPELSDRSKEIIADYRRQHGFGTAGERNLRRALGANDEYERKLRE